MASRIASRARSTTPKGAPDPSVVSRVVSRAAATLEALHHSPPMHLESLVRALLVEPGSEACERSSSSAHPLVVPLALDARGRCVGVYVGASTHGRGGNAGFGFFHRDARADATDPSLASGGRLPIVAAGARGVSHLASSATLYVRRALAEDEGKYGVGGGAAMAACGGDAMDAYAPGELASSPFRDRVEVFLTKNVGRFMDVDESLIARHVEREDETSALVTAEWYANGPYAGWARPHGVNADTLMRYGRAVEARDQARVALSSGPWWTIGDDGALLTRMQTLSGYAGRSAADVRRTLDGGDVDMTGNADDGQPPPTKEELALKSATEVLDTVAWGGERVGWDSVRETVAERLDEAGLAELSRHVLAPLRASA